nr:polysaccharide deacetylase family protein [Evansella cellulosilytica]
MKKLILQVATFLCILLISLGSVQNPITSGYINELSEQAQTVMKEEDPLYMELLRRQADYEVDPQDAVVDKVWKAIPGLNGLSVNIQDSYEEMKEFGDFQEDKLVFHQIPPQKMLKDLPPSPIYRGHPEKPMVTFMVNVAWGNEYIPEMLEIMKKHDVKATFFLDGSWVKNNPKLAKMIHEEGHEIGNHAYSHPNMKNLSTNRILEELQKTNNIIKETLDVEPKWFAPPSGSYRQEVVDIAHKMDMYTVLWTVDTIDWKKPEPTSMAQRVVDKTDEGTLILMHPTSSTAKGLEMMIEGMKQKNLSIGTLSDTLSETRIHLNRR